jgi:hypothetical protein
MTHSKIHQAFSNYLKQPEALTDPEKYLGPKWEDVLNFWIYLDTLSNLEKREIVERYYSLDYNARYCAIDAARNAANEVIGVGFSDAACLAAWDITGWWVFGFATYELIAHHKLLEQNKTPLALQYCTKNVIV